MMKKWLLLLCSGLVVAQLHASDVVEVEVHGMTCGFCVDAVQRNLRKLPDVANAEVSLKQKKVKIYAKDEVLDFERIRQAIVNSGFTPIAIRTLVDEK